MLSLEGRRLLITGGPTRAYLDAVRYLSNRSTGQLGALLAEQAVAAGAQVLYVYGEGSLLPRASQGPGRLEALAVETVTELEAVVRDHVGNRRYDAMIHAMAVLDFAPVEVRPGKTSSEEGEWLIRLVPTPKVIHRIKEWDPGIFLVGFKLEVGTDDAALVAAARRLMARSGADAVVANDLQSLREGVHRGIVVRPGHAPEPVAGKEEIARRVVALVGEALVAGRGSGDGGARTLG